MTISTSDKNTHALVLLIIIILPFLIFYWMAPFIASQSIGNDYQSYSIENQMEIQFSIKAGSFPLYVPYYAMGQSLNALTLGQPFHPLPYIASIMPGYWNGKALQWNTFLRLLSLGLAHLALFAFLRRLKISMLFSFILSCITVYNMRMLDLFRYGASLETYTGYLFLCSAIGFYYIDPGKIRMPAFIIGSTYLLVSSGHPQNMYYGLLGAGLFTLVVPSFVSVFLPEKNPGPGMPLNFWIKGISLIGIGLLLSAIYVLPFYYEFIATNTGRIDMGYGWADSIRDTFLGTLNSFFLPYRADIHGAFGGSSLILIAPLIPLLYVFKVKIPRSIWVICGILLVAFLHMQGARTPVHRLAWEYLPFASYFRYAGRVSLIMPVFIMILLAWAVHSGSIQVRSRRDSITLTPLSLLVIFALIATVLFFVFIAVSLLLPDRNILEFGFFIPATIQEIPHWIEVLVIVLGAASLLLLYFHNTRPNAAGTLGLLLCIVTCVQIALVLKYGTYVTERRDRPTFEQMQTQKKTSLDYPLFPGTGMYHDIVVAQLENSFMEPFLGKVYHDPVTVSSPDDAYTRMLQGRTPQQIFIEGYKAGTDLSLTSREPGPRESNVKLIYSSFNRLQFRVFSATPAFFTLSYPYTSHWNAFVNGNKLEVYRANGIAHAVSIPKGESLIEFRYWSQSTFWGVIISCATFILTGLYISMYALGGPTRILSGIIILALGLGVPALWHDSLYNGSNLGTEYRWEYEPPKPGFNLAYGKRTSLSIPRRGSPGFLHSSRAVDGYLVPGSGFSTAKHDNPTWTVDLNQTEQIKSIVLYEHIDDKLENIRPLHVQFSNDGRQWRTAASISTKVNTKGPTRLGFAPLETTRYIQIQATGVSRIRFDEVEVYGPDSNN